jgi:hypothetical protein
LHGGVVQPQQQSMGIVRESKWTQRHRQIVPHLRLKSLA